MDWKAITHTLTIILSIAGIVVFFMNGIRTDIASIRAEAAAQAAADRAQAAADRAADRAEAAADRAADRAEAAADRRAHQAAMDTFRQEMSTFRREMRAIAERQAYVEGAVNRIAVASQ